MKKSKYILCFLISIFLCLTHIYADCTNEEIDKLKDEAENIKITYKHLGKVETEDGPTYNQFEVTIKNIPDDFYVSLLNGTLKYTPTDGTITDIYNSGTWNFEFYSNKCQQKIDEIKVKIPRFNLYSLDPLCEGIDGNDFPLCGKYYDYDVSYESFKQQVNHYRATYKIGIENPNKESNDNSKLGKILNTVLNFIKTYQLYFIIALLLIIIIIIASIVIIKRKKRGVLQ